MQKTPVNRGVLSLLNGSKQVQNGLLVTGFISDDLAVIGIQEIAEASRAARPREPLNADESPEAASTDTSAGWGPDFADSSRFHSAPFQRRPVNRSTGPRFHSAPFHRLKSSKTGRPRRCESESFRKVPSAGKPRIRAFAKLPHSHRPQNQPDLCHPGKPLALRLPATRQATARVSPSRQKSVSATPRARFVFPLSPPQYARLSCFMPAHEPGMKPASPAAPR
jgi:hypothetical protein